jgi:Flp pilus assembly protein TadD
MTAAAATGEPLPPVPEAASVAFLEALDAMAAGNWFDAETRLERLATEYPWLTGPHVNLAIVYRESGRSDAARAALARALELDPDHPAANNELGILEREAGEFAAAEAAYRRAIAADPGYALARYNLGVLLDLYLRRQDEALPYYETYQALAAAPDPEVAFWVVDLRRRLGLPTEPSRLAREDSE